MVTAYHRPRDAAEALALLASVPGSLALAGGTQLLSAEWRGRPFEAIALEGLLPRGLSRGPSPGGALLAIGAASTFQDLLDSSLLPGALRAAVLGMVDRNIRNRATVGGNLGADKSCSSLLPILLALDAALELADGRRLALESWLELPPGQGAGARGLIARVEIPFRPGRLAAYTRWSRLSCDLSLLSVGLSYGLAGGRVAGLRLVMGGVAAKARRFPAIEAAFEGQALPGRDAIEATVAPLLAPVTDVRASAAFKRLRASALVAEAFGAATEVGTATAAGGAGAAASQGATS